MQKAVLNFYPLPARRHVLAVEMTYIKFRNNAKFSTAERE